MEEDGEGGMIGTKVEELGYVVAVAEAEEGGGCGGYGKLGCQGSEGEERKEEVEEEEGGEKRTWRSGGGGGGGNEGGPWKRRMDLLLLTSCCVPSPLPLRESFFFCFLLVLFLFLLFPSSSFLSASFSCLLACRGGIPRTVELDRNITQLTEPPLYTSLHLVLISSSYYTSISISISICILNSTQLNSD